MTSTLASDATITVFNPLLTGNSDTETVTGKCFANRPYYLYVEDPSFNRSQFWTEYLGVASADGTFSVHINSQGENLGFDLTELDLLYVECRSPKGDFLVSMGEAT